VEQRGAGEVVCGLMASSREIIGPFYCATSCAILRVVNPAYTWHVFVGCAML
jgi:hypothetical protein